MASPKEPRIIMSFVRTFFATSLALVGGACASGGNAPGNGPGESKAPALARDVSVRDVALLQAHEISIVVDGAPLAPSIPIVAGRDAVVRIGVEVSEGFTSRTLRGEVSITPPDGGEPEVFEVLSTVSGSSSHDALDSTLNVPVPGASIVPGAKYSVAVYESELYTEAEAGALPGVVVAPRLPGAETLDLEGVVDAGPPMKVVIVPIRYEADGSGRVPDTSEAALEIYRLRMQGMYPTSRVELTLGEEWPWDGPDVQPFGAGWGELLDSFANDHHGAGSDSTAYYYGLFEPASSAGSYCSQGCVAGLSYSSDSPGFDVARSSIGLAFAGLSVDTMVHEIGHAQGQSHAPCGLFDNSADPAYPYDDASIGVWGYDPDTKLLRDPASVKDVMSYCENVWVSDYVYGNWLERAIDLAALASVVGAAPSEHWTFSVRADGTLGYAGSQLRAAPAGGAPRKVLVRDAEGASLGEVVGRFAPYDHLPGGVLVVPVVEGAGTVELALE